MSLQRCLQQSQLTFHSSEQDGLGVGDMIKILFHDHLIFFKLKFIITMELAMKDPNEINSALHFSGRLQ